MQEQRKLDMKRIWSEESEESIEEYYKKKYASTPAIGYVCATIIVDLMVFSCVCVLGSMRWRISLGRYSNNASYLESSM